MEIKLLADQGGHKTGSRLVVEDHVGQLYINAKYAEEVKPVVVEAPAVGTDGASLQSVEMMANVMAKAFKDAGIGQVSVVRPEATRRITGLSFAEPDEEKSFGDWLYHLTYAGFTPDRLFMEKCSSTLINRYGTRPVPNFGHEYKAAFGSTENLSKGVHGGTLPGMQSKASAQSETSGPLGGFAVPIQYSNQLFELIGDFSILLPRVRKYPMTTLQMNIPAIDYSLGGSGASPYLGGMIAAWKAEGATFPQTNVSLREIELKANLLAGYTVASRQLLADNKVGLERVLTDLMARTIAFYVDYAILNGTGANQPIGILNAPATIFETRTGDSSNGTTLADFASIYGALLPESDSRSFWLIPPSMKTKLIQMNDKSGRVVYQPVYPGTDGGPATRAMPLSIFGLSTFCNQLTPAAGTKGDITLIDPDGYGFGMRQEIEIGVSEHVNWLTNQLTYRFLFRADGQPMVNTYLTLANGDQVSPFVARNS